MCLIACSNLHQVNKSTRKIKYYAFVNPRTPTSSFSGNFFHEEGILKHCSETKKHKRSCKTGQSL